MDFKSTTVRNISTVQHKVLLCVVFQIVLATLSAVSVMGCFPYHRGKVETSIVKLEHIDKVRLISPYTSTGNVDNYRQTQSPNVSVIVNFILPTNSEAKKGDSSEAKTKGVHLDKLTQLKLAETVNKVLYGHNNKRT